MALPVNVNITTPGVVIQDKPSEGATELQAVYNKPYIDQLQAAIAAKFTKIDHLGLYVGSFDDWNALPKNLSDARLLHSVNIAGGITVNDFATVKNPGDNPLGATSWPTENLKNSPARFVVSGVDAGNGNIMWEYDLSYDTDVTGKMDLVPGATQNNVAIFDENGQVVDSGRGLDDIGSRILKLAIGRDENHRNYANDLGISHFTVGDSGVPPFSLDGGAIQFNQGDMAINWIDNTLWVYDESDSSSYWHKINELSQDEGDQYWLPNTTSKNPRNHNGVGTSIGVTERASLAMTGDAILDIGRKSESGTAMGVFQISNVSGTGHRQGNGVNNLTEIEMSGGATWTSNSKNLDGKAYIKMIAQAVEETQSGNFLYGEGSGKTALIDVTEDSIKLKSSLGGLDLKPGSHNIVSRGYGALSGLQGECAQVSSQAAGQSILQNGCRFYIINCNVDITLQKRAGSFESVILTDGVPGFQVGDVFYFLNQSSNASVEVKYVNDAFEGKSVEIKPQETVSLIVYAASYQNVSFATQILSFIPMSGAEGGGDTWSFTPIEDPIVF